jgi:tripartite-type tricarboxylate transporter receptor subunit TctC
MIADMRIAIAIACAVIAPIGAAQSYPKKPVRWIVPFPPGGSVDAVARRLGPALAGTLGQQVVLDNRTGASGNIAAELAKQLGDQGLDLTMSPPEAFTAFLESELAKWGKVVKERGMRAD